MSRFKYPATRLQYDLELRNAWPFAIDQLACTTLLAAARIARSLCLTEGIERALCVSSEFFPANAGREAIFNCTSDAACAILIERNGTRNRLVSATNVTKGYYWDVEAMRDEIVASYFPTARHVLLRTIADAGWEPSDVDWIIPHNVSMRSWEILSSLVRLPRARLFSDNIVRHGHTLAGDNFINYRDALDGGCIQPGPARGPLFLRLRRALDGRRRGGMMTITRVLVTGASGLVGEGVLRQMLLDDPTLEAFVLVRNDLSWKLVASRLGHLASRVVPVERRHNAGGDGPRAPRPPARPARDARRRSRRGGHQLLEVAG